jgi:hypothetical protein
MIMKKQRLIFLLSGFLLLGVACNSNSNKSNTDSLQQNESVAQIGQYTCPMHPEVVSDHPGDCPKCGMKLEKVKDNVDSASVPKSDSLAM